MSQMISYEKELAFQANRRKATVSFINTVHDLWYEKSIELVLFRNQLIDRNVSEILNLHDYAGKFVQKPISIFDSTEIAQALRSLNLPPSKIDIGKLTYEYHSDDNTISDVQNFVAQKLKAAKTNGGIQPKDVVLYGFGRIGRLVARELMARTGKGSQLRLRAIVTRGSVDKTVLEKRASLLRYDSVHGEFSGTVDVNADAHCLIINGTTVPVISANAPEDVDYTVYGIQDALVIDNTGAFRDDVALGRHLQAKGVAKVLLTAPGKGVPNIVYGVNQWDYNPDEIAVYSAASCTTNLVDNFHKKYRRGRAAGLNMVITETGAGKAVSKALPEMEGKLTSNAIRVPVPNGSLAILNLELDREASVNGINDTLKQYALEGNLVEQIKYELNDELVSSDILGSSAPAIFDSKATIVSPEGNKVVLYVWYDNEYGYSHQVIRLAKYIAKVRRFTYY